MTEDCPCRHYKVACPCEVIQVIPVDDDEVERIREYVYSDEYREKVH